MIPELRAAFNRGFTEQKYSALCTLLDRRCGTEIGFRISETPTFISRELLAMMADAGVDMLRQLMSNQTYLAESRKVIPPEYNFANDTPQPLFVAFDFGLVREEDGRIAPKLIELQGFPTLYAYQPVLAETYREVYGLPAGLRHLLSDLDLESYHRLVRRAILGHHDPHTVVLLELDPHLQKTLPDFLLTERLCGIRTVNIRDVIKDGKRLFYPYEGKKIPISRIYNRTIVDELIRKEVRLPFDPCEELDVEWAGHPNWFFRLSKFSLPFLKHPTVPRTFFLSDLSPLPEDLDRWVLKPLFSFAGSGVIVGPTKEDLARIPETDRQKYILQERIEYAGVVESPYGGTKTEFRIMYIWEDEPVAVNQLVRMGRGKMMGVDHNRNMVWVGSSAGFYEG
jgi:hypothetical protein